MSFQLRFRNVAVANFSICPNVCGRDSPCTRALPHAVQESGNARLENRRLHSSKVQTPPGDLHRHLTVVQHQQ
jgi:hypothetical protein